MGEHLKPPLAQIPPTVAAVADYEPLARERMGAPAWAWLQGGAADEITLRENRAAFERLRLAPRVLAELAGGHTRLTLLGQALDHPLLVAPMASHGLAHPDGELATVLAAAAMRTPVVVSTQSGTPLEALAQAAGAAQPPMPLWFQLYLQPDRGFTRALVQRAEAAGYRALVLTVDAPVSGARNTEQRAGFVPPPGLGAVNLQGARPLPPHTARPGQPPLFGSPLLDAAPTWRDIAWLREQTALPIVLKGVLAPADAVRAADEGLAGAIVSNHGGRVLDTVPATLDALPAIAQAVQGRLPLLLDGGVRRGTDVFKALALGASAVLVGRPVLHGLAAAGAPGVAHVLHLLRTELEMAMALCGCRTLDEIDASRLWRG
ncbi:alpha-hydroxy acid oxidase [Hydrogenophaga sp. T2]|uniref:alpha-hydroxy acid oxidase n=1 Tax=Hydrogenophaga sp. T2 TaxID=3132823 RepID=UPI003CF2BC01